jgi:Holliday junction resolvase-like predicted endonuclease
MRVQRRKRGQRIEKIAFDYLKKKKYLVWKPVRVMFHSQDIFGLFDLIALNKKELKLIQVQKERKRPYKVKKIFKLPKPKKISYELWIYNPKTKEFKIFINNE